MTRRTMSTTAWCGFENGRPAKADDDVLLCAAGDDMNKYGTGLFRTRAKALSGYRDVRGVTITWDVPAKKKARRA